MPTKIDSGGGYQAGYDDGQSAGSMTMKAFGDVPTVDIPIRIIFRGEK